MKSAKKSPAIKTTTYIFYIVKKTEAILGFSRYPITPLHQSFLTLTLFLKGKAFFVPKNTKKILYRPLIIK